MAVRIENDSFGSVEVPANKYYGAQTARSFANFAIGGETERMPIQVIHAFGYLKKSCALVNVEYGMNQQIVESIVRASDEIIAGKLDDHYLANRLWDTIEYERE